MCRPAHVAALSFQSTKWGIGLTQYAYFPLLKHIKQILFLTFFNTPAGIEAYFWTDGWTNRQSTVGQRMKGQADVKVELFI